MKKIFFWFLFFGFSKIYGQVPYVNKVIRKDTLKTFFITIDSLLDKKPYGQNPENGYKIRVVSMDYYGQIHRDDIKFLNYKKEEFPKTYIIWELLKIDNP